MDDALIEILACPKCKGTLDKIDDEAFVCHACGLRYEIRDGIPNFLIEDAKPVQDDDESGVK